MPDDAILFESWGLRTGPIPTKADMLQELSDRMDAIFIGIPVDSRACLECNPRQSSKQLELISQDKIDKPRRI